MRRNGNLIFPTFLRLLSRLSSFDLQVQVLRLRWSRVRQPVSMLEYTHDFYWRRCDAPELVVFDGLRWRVSCSFFPPGSRVSAFCGLELTSLLYLLASSTSDCGGWYTMSLYYSQPVLSSISASSTSAAASATSSAPVPAASGWSAGTCVTDGSSPRLLTGSGEPFSPFQCRELIKNSPLTRRVSFFPFSFPNIQ